MAVTIGLSKESSLLNSMPSSRLGSPPAETHHLDVATHLPSFFLSFKTGVSKVNHVWLFLFLKKQVAKDARRVSVQQHFALLQNKEVVYAHKKVSHWNGQGNEDDTPDGVDQLDKEPSLILHKYLGLKCSILEGWWNNEIWQHVLKIRGLVLCGRMLSLTLILFYREKKRFGIFAILGHLGLR